MNLASRALRQALFVAALASGLAGGAAFAANSYAVRNLVSDGGVPAEHRDDNLKNGWGIALSATSPIWVPITAPACTPRKCPARSSIRISPPTSRRSTFWPSAGGRTSPANNGSTAQNLPSNTRFFAAGPNGEENGVFGRIDAASP